MDKEHISIIIIDDHQMVIEGLKSILSDSEEVKVISFFLNANSALEFLKDNKVDVILLDVNLPDMNGVEVCGTITEKYPTIKTIGLSTYNEPSIINQMIKNGVKGYLLKNASGDELVHAIKQIHKGSFYFGEEIQKILAQSVVKTNDTPKLTRREKEILQLIAEGMTTNLIADKLFISPLTVETHRRNLMHKMDVSNAAALIKVSIEKELI